MSKRSSDELLQIAVGPVASLDVLKLDDGGALVVLSERGNIQRRTVVQLEQVDVIKMAKFLAGLSVED